MTVEETTFSDAHSLCISQGLSQVRMNRSNASFSKSKLKSAACVSFLKLRSFKSHHLSYVCAHTHVIDKYRHKYGPRSSANCIKFCEAFKKTLVILWFQDFFDSLVSRYLCATQLRMAGLYL